MNASAYMSNVDIMAQAWTTRLPANWVTGVFDPTLLLEAAELMMGSG